MEVVSYEVGLPSLLLCDLTRQARQKPSCQSPSAAAVVYAQGWLSPRHRTAKTTVAS